MNPIYDNEAQMRANWPMLANHLATIAIYREGIFDYGIYTAQTGGKTYQWRASK